MFLAKSSVLFSVFVFCSTGDQTQAPTFPVQALCHGAIAQPLIFPFHSEWGLPGFLFFGNFSSLTSGMFTFCFALVAAFSPVTSALSPSSRITCSSPSAFPQAVGLVTGSFWILGKWLLPLAGALALHFLFPLTWRAPWKPPVPPVLLAGPSCSSAPGEKHSQPWAWLLLPFLSCLCHPTAQCLSSVSRELHSPSASALHVLVFKQFATSLTLFPHKGGVAFPSS